MLWVSFVIFCFLFPFNQNWQWFCVFDLLTENEQMNTNKLWWHHHVRVLIYVPIKWTKKMKISHRDDVTIKPPSFRVIMLMTFDINDDDYRSPHLLSFCVYCVREILHSNTVHFYIVSLRNLFFWQLKPSYG